MKRLKADLSNLEDAFNHFGGQLEVLCHSNYLDFETGNIPYIKDDLECVLHAIESESFDKMPNSEDDVQEAVREKLENASELENVSADLILGTRRTRKNVGVEDSARPASCGLDGGRCSGSS